MVGAQEVRPNLLRRRVTDHPSELSNSAYAALSRSQGT